MQYNNFLPASVNMSEKITNPTYLDFNATTPLDPRVFEAMKEWYLGPPANAGSRTHDYGQRAREAVEKARKQVARVIGSGPNEIVFTSGATESNNLTILGLRRHAEQTGRRHIISTSIEHKAVLEPLDQLDSDGLEIQLAPVTYGGYVEPDEIGRRLRPDTLLVSVMHANNETGLVQPVLEIAELLEDTSTFFHTDAAQTFGKELNELRRLKCDFMSISGHKIFGPQGIGAMYVRRQGTERCSLLPLMRGGGQESGLRPGTLPVPLIVGLGKASELAAIESEQRRAENSRVRDLLLRELGPVDFVLNGDQHLAQSHVLNISFLGIDSEALMTALRADMAISNGAACSSRRHAPSHVLKAMGLDDDRIGSAVQFSWGHSVSRVPAEFLVRAVGQLREVGKIYGQ